MTEQKRKKKAYYEANKEYLKAKSKEYYNNNKAKCNKLNLERNIIKYHKITIEEYYIDMSTSDVCEICGSSDNLCRDHCHTTMEFRGVLCSTCNRALGMLGDTEASITNVLKYLKG